MYAGNTISDLLSKYERKKIISFVLTDSFVSRKIGRSAIFTMNPKLEQRICVKFCVANGITAAETLRMLKNAFGEDAMSQNRTFVWHKEFKEGREEVDDMPRSGRPSTASTDENIEAVKNFVLENRSIGIREIAALLDISFGSAEHILVDILGMRRVAARLVPKELNFLQKQRRVEVAKQMIANADSDPTFMKRIITGDETWVYEFDMPTSQQSSEWRVGDEPKPKKPRQSRSKIKVLLTVFFDCEGVVHAEFLPDGQTVNKEYYLQVMRRLREAIRKKRPELWKNNSWILHHDNAPSHTALLICEFLAKNSTNIISQPPYSPDLAPCDFFLFPKLKIPLRGTRYDSIEAIKKNSLDELKAIPSAAYKKCMEDWVKRWHMCM